MSAASRTPISAGWKGIFLKRKSVIRFVEVNVGVRTPGNRIGALSAEPKPPLVEEEILAYSRKEQRGKNLSNLLK